MVFLIQTTPKNGSENFIGLNNNLLDYWRWAHSDIASNAERGKLAEYIVKCAVGAENPCRVEWDAVDVVSPDGIRIEVKSSAYLQTWSCNKLSNIQFDIAPKLSWNSETNLYYDTIGRNSDVYVFCLFACKDPALANPLDLSQWEFYVLSTKILDAKIPKQKTITLNSLKKLGAIQIEYSKLNSTIQNISNQHKD